MGFNTNNLREKATLISLGAVCALGGTACGHRSESLSPDQAQTEISAILGTAAVAEMRAAMRSPSRPDIVGSIGLDLRDLADPDGLSTIYPGNAVIQIKAPVNKQKQFIASGVEKIYVATPPVERGLCDVVQIVRVNHTWIGDTGRSTLAMDEDDPIARNPLKADTVVPADASPEVINKKIQTAKDIASTLRRRMAKLLAHPNQPGTGNSCEDPH